MSADQIILYDVASKLGAFTTGPNGWKARLVLNYKGLDYKTIYIKVKNVQSEVKAIGAPPTLKYPDGSDRWTLPALRTPSGEFVADSLLIAKRLDELYPEKPVFRSAGDFQTAKEFVDFFLNFVIMTVAPLLKDGTDVTLDPESAEYVRRVVLQNVPFAPAAGTAERDDLWSNIRAAWSKLGEHLDGKESNLFVDFVVVGFLMSIRNILSKEDWSEHVEKWDNGRWVGLLDKYGELTERNA